MRRRMGPEAEARIVAVYRASEAAPLDAMVVEMSGVLEQLPVEQTTLSQWVSAYALLIQLPAEAR